MHLANLQVKTYDLKNASRNYKAVLTSKDTNLTQIKYFAGMALGDILYSQGDYDASKKLLQKIFLSTSTDVHFKGITALKIGLSHLFEGDSLSASFIF